LLLNLNLFILFVKRINYLSYYKLLWYYCDKIIIYYLCSDTSPQINKQVNFLLPFMGFGFNYTWLSLHGHLSFSNTPIQFPEYPLKFPIQVYIRTLLSNTNQVVQRGRGWNTRPLDITSGGFLGIYKGRSYTKAVKRLKIDFLNLRVFSICKKVEIFSKASKATFSFIMRVNFIFLKTNLKTKKLSGYVVKI